MSRRIGIWGVCDTGGLTLALQQLLPNDQIVPLQSFMVGDELTAWFSDLPKFVDVLITPISRELPECAAAMEETGFQILRYPVTVFRAFHPDLFYVGRKSDGKLVEPHYNSLICVWSFVNEVSADGAVSLFNAGTFEALGYFDQWNSSVAALQIEYERCGLDFPRYYLRVKRLGAFMHSFNHPKAQSLVTLARLLACKLGAPRSVMDDPVEIADSLASMNWPIYPDIGAVYGLRTIYAWPAVTPGGPSIGLQDFVANSYRRYTELGLRRDDIFFNWPNQADNVLPARLER